MMAEVYTLLSLQSYLHDPCGTSSVPYWKQKRIIIHGRDSLIDGCIHQYGVEN